MIAAMVAYKFAQVAVDLYAGQSFWPSRDFFLGG